MVAFLAKGEGNGGLGGLDSDGKTMMTMVAMVGMAMGSSKARKRVKMTFVGKRRVRVAFLGKMELRDKRESGGGVPKSL